MSLNVKEEVWTGKINVGINIWIFEEMELFEISKGESIARKEIYKRLLEQSVFRDLVQKSIIFRNR